MEFYGNGGVSKGGHICKLMNIYAEVLTENNKIPISVILLNKNKLKKRKKETNKKTLNEPTKILIPHETAFACFSTQKWNFKNYFYYV